MRSFYKSTRTEARGIVRILLLDPWSEMIVAWFIVVAVEMVRRDWILDVFKKQS